MRRQCDDRPAAPDAVAVKSDEEEEEEDVLATLTRRAAYCSARLSAR